jgi:hypothetical protein
MKFNELTKPELVRMFKAECSDRSDNVDPQGEHDWHSLTVGWAIAKGVDPEDALRFASHIRYCTNLG